MLVLQVPLASNSLLHGNPAAHLNLSKDTILGGGELLSFSPSCVWWKFKAAHQPQRESPLALHQTGESQRAPWEGAGRHGAQGAWPTPQVRVPPLSAGSQSRRGGVPVHSGFLAGALRVCNSCFESSLYNPVPPRPFISGKGESGGAKTPPGEDLWGDAGLKHKGWGLGMTPPQLGRERSKALLGEAFFAPPGGGMGGSGGEAGWQGRGCLDVSCCCLLRWSSPGRRRRRAVGGAAAPRQPPASLPPLPPPQPTPLLSQAKQSCRG